MAQDEAANKDNPLGRSVKRLRQARGWTQVDLAMRARVRPSTIQNIESGRVARPSTLPHIAAALGVNPADLDGDTPPHPAVGAPDFAAHLRYQISELREDLKVLAEIRSVSRGTRKLVARSIEQEIERLEDQLAGLPPFPNGRDDNVADTREPHLATNGD